MINLRTDEWELTGIDTIFFDKDGTFVDSHTYWGEIIRRRIQKTIEQYDLPASDMPALCQAMGYDLSKKKLTEAGPVGIVSREEVIEHFLQELQARYQLVLSFQEMDELFKEVHAAFKQDSDQFIVPLKGCVGFFEYLKQHDVRMAVITSDAKEMTWHTLTRLDLAKYFDLVITKEDHARPKRTGDPALLALKKLNAEPERTIAIGDAPMDAQMANNAHLKAAVLIATGQISYGNLKKSSDFVVGNYGFGSQDNNGCAFTFESALK